MSGEYQRTLALVGRLIDDEQRLVAQLAQLGAQHDGAEVIYSFEPPTALGQACGFLCYEDGALVGFAAIQSGEEPEVSGTVHPAQRRKGIGYGLLEAVRAECRRRGAASLLLTVNEASSSGQAFAAAVGAERVMGEYRMALDSAALDQTRSRNAALQLRQAGSADVSTIVQITAAAFGDPEEEVRAFVEREIAQPDQRFFLAQLAGAPIGSLRVSSGDEGCFITALGVLPTYQGQGHGRQILNGIVALLRAEGQDAIMLEVATDNRNALALYHACGFRETAAFGYYRLATADGQGEV